MKPIQYGPHGGPRFDLSRAVPTITFFAIAAIAFASLGCGGSDGAAPGGSTNGTEAGTEDVGTLDAEGQDAALESGPDGLEDVAQPDSTTEDALPDSEADAQDCPPGSELDDAGNCVPVPLCQQGTCNHHGTCTESPTGPQCTCDEGWGLPDCAHCDTAAGYHEDGAGGCTTDPCTPNPCLDPGRVCEADGTTYTCECKPGTHDEGGVCVVDTTCGPNSCNDHGTCSDAGGSVTCACEAGWAGPACDGCDAVAGYHPDGTGGCTTDPCVPNPCQDEHQTICASAGGIVQCSCDPGHHDELGVCVADDVCLPTSCSGHGACGVVGGYVTCDCETGWIGDVCDVCNASAGYHEDGNGGCTTDPCTPNPCGEPNMGVCEPQGTVHSCACDPGFHDDGAGGCTDDPCVPNFCLVQNQSCRVVAGVAECYTPDCDDLNPCTNDSLVGGVCQHIDVANGTTCQTSLCLTEQTCSQGVCSTGTPLDCSDGNPCTLDTCSESAGCEHADDNTLIPDDGVTCTVDTCTGGVASNVADDGICDDGVWCSGVEQCEPADTNADADGCVHTDVPSPPLATGTCRGYGPCDEATQSFPVVTAAPGTTCDDGIECTTADRCDSDGSCKGTITGSCSGGCGTPGVFDGDLDIPVAAVQGTITLAGASLPATNTDYDGADIYLVAKDTGAAHHIGGYRYSYSGGSYVLTQNYYGGKVLAGVYDVLYRRYWDREYNTVSRTTSDKTHVAGYRLLARDVVVGAGDNVLDIDIPVATVGGTITLAGQPLPATNTDYDGADIYLVAKDTGAAHHIGGYRYSYSGGSYVLTQNYYGGKVPSGHV